MKRLALVLMLLTRPAVACVEGCYPYSGNCICEERPASVASAPPSDEKPPRSGKPATVGDMPESLTYKDAEADRTVADADRDGKIAAGILGKNPK